MLLVDNHQAEPIESDVLLENRLGSDDEIDFSGGDFFKRGGLKNRHVFFKLSLML